MFYSFPSIYCLKWIVQVLRPTDACIMSLYCYLKPRDKSKFSFPRRQRLKPLFWNNGFMLRVFGVVWDASDTIVFTQQIQSSHMYVSPKRPCVIFLFCCNHELTRYTDWTFFSLLNCQHIKIFGPTSYCVPNNCVLT